MAFLSLVSSLLALPVVHGAAAAIALQKPCDSGATPPEKLVTISMVAWMDKGLNATYEKRKAHVKRIIEVANGVLRNDVGLQIQVKDYKDHEHLDCEIQPEPAVKKFAEDAKVGKGEAYQFLFTNCWDDDGFSGPTDTKGAAIQGGDDGVMCEDAFHGINWIPKIGTCINTESVYVFVHELAHNLGYQHYFPVGSNNYVQWNHESGKCNIFTQIRDFFQTKAAGNQCVSNTIGVIKPGQIDDCDAEIVDRCDANCNDVDCSYMKKQGNCNNPKYMYYDDKWAFLKFQCAKTCDHSYRRCNPPSARSLQRAGAKVVKGCGQPGWKEECKISCVDGSNVTTLDPRTCSQSFTEMKISITCAKDAVLDNGSEKELRKTHPVFAETSTFEQEIFDCHNIVRCMNGQSRVEWDNSLANEAKTSVIKNGFKHSRNEKRKNGKGGTYGENLASGAGGKRACLMYWAEAENYPGKGVTGHFTAMTWKTVSSMGCGEGKGKTSACWYNADANSPNTTGKHEENVIQGCHGRSQDECEQDPKINPLGQKHFSLPRDIYCGGEKRRGETKEEDEGKGLGQRSADVTTLAIGLTLAFLVLLCVFGIWGLWFYCRRSDKMVKENPKTSVMFPILRPSVPKLEQKNSKAVRFSKPRPGPAGVQQDLSGGKSTRKSKATEGRKSEKTRKSSKSTRISTRPVGRRPAESTSSARGSRPVPIQKTQLSAAEAILANRGK